MATNYSPKIVTDGLVFCVDAGDKKSHSGTTTIIDRTGNVANGTIQNFSSANGDEYTSDFGGGITRTTSSVNTQTNTSNINNYSAVTFDATASNIAFSLECIWRASAFSTDTYFGLENVLIAKGGFSTLNYLMQVNSTQLTFCSRSPNEGLQYRDFSTTFNTNEVYHTVLTVIDNDFSGGSRNVRAYRNGVYLNEMALTADPIQPDDDGDDPLYYPAGGGTTDNLMNFKGTYFVARIYNKRLTDAEVLQNFNAQRGRFGI